MYMEVFNPLASETRERRIVKSMAGVSFRMRAREYA